MNFVLEHSHLTSCGHGAVEIGGRWGGHSKSLRDRQSLVDSYLWASWAAVVLAKTVLANFVILPETVGTLCHQA